MYKSRLLSKLESDRMICDFCAAFHPVRVYASKQMSTGHKVEVWRWAACADCTIAIQSEDWTTLRKRIKDAFLDMRLAVTDKVAEYAITVSLQEFFDWAVKEYIQ